MCEHGTDVPVRVKVPADLSATGAAHWRDFGIDACIAPIVAALQGAGIDMRASCCGHGAGPGRIDLADGRVLVIHATDSRAGASVLAVDPASNASGFLVHPSSVTEENVFRGAPETAPLTVTGISLIAAERERQVSVEGWTPEHDSQHRHEELAEAAVGYLVRRNSTNRRGPQNWPWDIRWWKPSTDPVRNLVKAGALIAAEIDRLLRLPMP